MMKKLLLIALTSAFCGYSYPAMIPLDAGTGATGDASTGLELIAAFNSNFTEVYADIATTNTALTAAVASINSDLVGVNAAITAANSSITALATDVSAAETDIATLETDVSAAEADILQRSLIGHTHVGTAVSVTPSGNLTSTNVQAALLELQSQIDTLAGNTGSTPPTVTLATSATAVDSGDPATLTWTTTNADACTGSDGWTGSKTASGGSEVISNITVTDDYVITCTNTDGSDNDTVTITVNVPPTTTGEWEELANTNLDAINPCPADNCIYSGNLGFESIMDAWSGGVVIDNKLVVWGGGHLAYDGNEVAQFDLTAHTWSLYTQPTPYDASVDGSPGSVGTPIAPGSRHTYSSLAVYNDRYLTVFGDYGVSATGTSFGDDMWVLDMQQTGTPVWEKRGVIDSGGGAMRAGATMYNRVTNTLWYAKEGGGRLYQYDFVNDTHTFRGFTPGVTQYSGAAVDTTRNRGLMIVGGFNPGRVYAFDFTTTTPTITRVEQLPIWTGAAASTIQEMQSMGIDYDPVNDVYMVWDGSGKTYYTIDGNTFEPKEVTPAAGAVPGAASVNGTFGRLRYSPVDGYFYLVNATNQNVFRINLTPATTASTDWTTRSTAPGVIQATNFDTATEVSNWVLGDSAAANVVYETGIKTSGNGSLRFNVRNTDVANSGNWKRWLATDKREFTTGDDFYVSFRQYIPQFYRDHRFLNSTLGGWKISILSRRAQVMNDDDIGAAWCSANDCGSNQLNEIVLNNGRYRGYPQGYNRDTEARFLSWDESIATACSGSDFKHQIAVDRAGPFTGTACEQDQQRYGGLFSTGVPSYGESAAPSSLTGANVFPADGWITYKIYVDLGQFGANVEDTTIKVWVAKNGSPWDLIVDKDPANGNGVDLGAGPNMDTLWLTPFDTGKQADGTRQDTYTLYDEVIVSLNDIAAPST